MSDQTLPRSDTSSPTVVPHQAGPPAIETANGVVHGSKPPRRGLWAMIKRDKRPLAGGFIAGALVLGIVWAAVGGLFGSNSFTLTGRMTLM